MALMLFLEKKQIFQIVCIPVTTRLCRDVQCSVRNYGELVNFIIRIILHKNIRISFRYIKQLKEPSYFEYTLPSGPFLWARPEPGGHFG